MRNGLLALLALAAAACGPASPTPNAATVPLDPAALAAARPDAVVQSGGSIQAAIDAAHPGSVIFVEAGAYAEALTVSKPLALVGLGAGAVLQNPGSAKNGVAVTGGPFALANFTVQGFGENGVLLTGVNGFLLDRVTAVSDGEYGLFPVFSRAGLIVGCTATGHTDTGIYVGQSRGVVVQGSSASANVNGIEIENSSQMAVLDNDTGNNALGILVDLLPGLQVTSAAGVLVRGNRVHDNDMPNTSPGGLAALVPTGSGVIVLGTDQVEVDENMVTGNRTVGIAVVSSEVLAALGVPVTGIEPNPDDVHVVGNVVVGNGTAPATTLFPGVDLLWDGSGQRDCWSGNAFQTSFPPTLPACP